MNAVVQIIAKNPASILIAGGLVFMAFGSFTIGWILIGLGILIHLIWLYK